MANPLQNLTTAQLAQYLRVSQRTIQRRAVKEQWPYEQTTSIGGLRKVFDYGCLPIKVRLQITAAILNKHQKQGQDYNSDAQVTTAIPCQTDFDNYLRPENGQAGEPLSWHCFSQPLQCLTQSKPWVKRGLLVLAKLYIAHHQLAKINGFDQFCQHYNQRQLNINPLIYRHVSHISRVSLLRWEKAHKPSPPDEANQSQHNADLQLITQEILMIKPTISTVKLNQYLRSIFKNRKLPGIKQLATWVKRYRTTHSKSNNAGMVDLW